MQSKLFSVFESVANPTIGLMSSYLIQWAVYPMLGINISHGTNLKITFIFFCVSMLRTYMIRRMFERIKWLCKPAHERGVRNRLREVTH